MQEKVQFTGIVVKNLDYQDNAQIVYILTKDELISVIIKGAKKIDSKTRPLAQIITKISGLRTKSSRISTFTEGVILDNFNDIKENYLKTQVTMCILEKIYYLYDNFSMPEKVYDFVEQVLEKIKKSNYPKSLLLLFEIKLWYLLGINPSFTNCIHCGDEIDTGCFDANGGGIVCYKCSPLHECDLDDECSKIIKYLYHIQMNKVDDNFLSLIDKFYDKITYTIDKYYATHLDFSNKSKEIYYKVI